MRQMQHEMQDLIGRTEDAHFLSIGQTAGYRPLKEPVNRDAHSLVTEPEMQFDSGSGGMREGHVMAARFGFAYGCLGAVAGFDQSVAGARQILRGYGQIEIHRRLAQKRGRVVAPGEHGSLQRYRWDAFAGKDA